MLYGVLLFVGFETAANLAEETKNPKRDIPLAVLTTVGDRHRVLRDRPPTSRSPASTTTSRRSPQAAGAPLFALGAPASAGGYGGVWINRLLELVVLLDMLAVPIGCAVAASRGLFAMARDRRLPARWPSCPGGTARRSARPSS